MNAHLIKITYHGATETKPSGVLLTPVKLVTNMRGNHRLHDPQRRGDKLVYALPGGGEVEMLP